MRIAALSLLLLALTIIGCTAESDDAPASLDNPVSENSSLPRLYTDDSGQVFMSWVEETGDLATLKYASYSKGSWTSPETIASDSTWFVNWADYPSVIAEAGKPLAAHWLQKVPGNTYSYNIELASFQGDSWSEPMLLHEDGTATEHGFVSMTQAGDGKILATWLDGRNTANRAQDEYADMDKAMTLRAAIVDTEGPAINEKFELDTSVCDCCNTASSRISDGYIVLYRDRTEEEIRDIYYTRYTNGSWSAPQPVHNDGWNIAGCPVNGPAVDAHKNTVAAMWFTGANDKAVVKMALSNDDGATFNEPIIVDEASPSGRVDLNISGNKIWTSWVGEVDGNAHILFRSYTMQGDQLTSYSIPFTKSRSAGFPQITSHEDGLLIAYTDISEDLPKVKTALLQ